MQIPFSKPFITGHEVDYINQALKNNKLSGDGPFTRKCQSWLESNTGSLKALLTHSCTAALEMAALLIDVQPGDEIIMSSYTFVSTANAFILRGGVPVFVDIRADTLNIDETKIIAAITAKTKAIVPVHYAGVACEMDTIMAIAKQYGLYVIEDAAQGIMATYKGKALGSIGHLGAYSFHDTKNIVSGEGGALLINDKKFIEMAEIIREKGTNRTQFLHGLVDKYTWVDKGSSFLPSELTAAFLWAQLEHADSITQHRIAMWNRYQEAFKSLQKNQWATCPLIPRDVSHNAHIYYLLLADANSRTAFIDALKKYNILSVFHYVPLHSSPFGKKHARAHGSMQVTDKVSATIARLPLWIGMENEVDYIVKNVKDVVFNLQHKETALV